MKRLTVSLCALSFIVGAAAGPVVAQDGLRAPGETNVAYRAADGTELRGYLAVPDGNGPFPAVLMIHEWWGLNNDITRLADAMAEEGFVVLAPDAFRGSVAQRAGQARRQIRNTPQEQIASDLDEAYRYLRNQEAVDPGRVAVMGFCFGGTQSMYLGTRAVGLAAVITLYGSNPIQRADELGRMEENEPVLGIFGAEDRAIPQSAVEGFEEALKNADVAHTITVYPDVGHAFVKSDTYDQGGAAEQAWNQVVSFLTEEL